MTPGGAGGTLLVGLICGWLRARRPTVGSFPPSAQQSLEATSASVASSPPSGLQTARQRLRPFNPRACCFSLWAWSSRSFRSTVATIVAASHPAPEPGHHLWRSAGAMTRGCGGHRMLRAKRTVRRPCSGLRCPMRSETSSDHPWPGDRDPYLIPADVATVVPLIQINVSDCSKERFCA
mgnify:CR=1 FL=1